MKPTIMCMQRLEKKYLLTREQYVLFINSVKDKITNDDYYYNTICNVYYDTDHYDMIENSVQKPIYKEKLRLRSYGIASENTNVFIEIKKKCKGIVNKRRIEIAYKDLNSMNEKMLSTQIGREINYALHFYKLKPKVFIAYDRFAYHGKEDESLRITFDFHIRSRFDHLNLAYGDQGNILLKNEECIMEIKVNESYPIWLTQILSQLKIYPVSFSKYGKIYTEMLCEGGNRLCSQV